MPSTLIPDHAAAAAHDVIHLTITGYLATASAPITHREWEQPGNATPIADSVQLTHGVVGAGYCAQSARIWTILGLPELALAANGERRLPWPVYRRAQCVRVGVWYEADDVVWWMHPHKMAGNLSGSGVAAAVQ